MDWSQLSRQLQDLADLDDRDQASQIAATLVCDAAKAAHEKFKGGDNDAFTLMSLVECLMSTSVRQGDKQTIRGILAGGILDIMRCLAPLGACTYYVSGRTLPAFFQYLLHSDTGVNPREACLAINETLTTLSKGSSEGTLYPLLLSLLQQLPDVTQRVTRQRLAVTIDALHPAELLLQDVCSSLQLYDFRCSMVDRTKRYSSHKDNSAEHRDDTLDMIGQQALQPIRKLIDQALDLIPNNPDEVPAAQLSNTLQNACKIAAASLHVLTISVPACCVCFNTKPAPIGPMQPSEQDTSRPQHVPAELLNVAVRAVSAMQRVLMLHQTMHKQEDGGSQDVDLSMQQKAMSWAQCIDIARLCGRSAAEQSDDDDSNTEDEAELNDGTPEGNSHVTVAQQSCLSGVACLIWLMQIGAVKASEGQSVHVHMPDGRVEAVHAVSEAAAALFESAGTRNDLHAVVTAMRLLQISGRAAAELPEPYQTGQAEVVVDVGNTEDSKANTSTEQQQSLTVQPGKIDETSSDDVISEEHVGERINQWLQTSSSTNIQKIVDVLRIVCVNVVHSSNESSRQAACSALPAVLSGLPTRERAAVLIILLKEPSAPLAALLLQRVRKEIAAANNSSRQGLSDLRFDPFASPLTLQVAAHELLKRAAIAKQNNKISEHCTENAGQAVEPADSIRDSTNACGVVAGLLAFENVEDVAAWCDVTCAALAIVRLLLLFPQDLEPIQDQNGTFVWSWLHQSLADSGFRHPTGIQITSSPAADHSRHAEPSYLKQLWVFVASYVESLLGQLKEALPRLQEASQAADDIHNNGNVNVKVPQGAVGTLPAPVVVFTSLCRLEEACRDVLGHLQTTV